MIATGWEIPPSYIQTNTNGSFSLIHNGAKHDLMSSGGRYHTKIETYLEIEKKSGATNEKGEYWIVVDTNGTEFRFGFNNDSENMLNTSDPAASPVVWRWSLDRIKDANGNCIYYSYIEDQGAVYPYRIEYNNDRLRAIEFLLEDRPDPYQDVDQGSIITVAKRLSRINISVSGSLVKSFKLGYDQIAAADSPVYALTSITKSGSDGTPLPPTTFTYKPYADNTVETTWLLDTITEDLGGKTTVTYSASANYPDNQLPENYWLVSSVTRDNGMTGPHHTTATTGFSYAHGRYDSASDEFRGFGEVTETRPDGSRVIHTFLQDDAKKGKESQTRIVDAAGNPYATTVNTWNATSDSGVYTVTLGRIDNYTYDGTLDTPKQTATEYQYDQYGNVTMEARYGDVDAYGDELFTFREYVANPDLWIVDKLKHTWSAESTGGPHLRETWYYYDGHSDLSAQPTVGNLTREEHFLNTGENPVTIYEYGSYGNRITTTDPEKRVTTVKYDDLFHTFPVRVTNAKGQTTTRDFNPANGQPTMVKDPNGYVTTYKYDVFNRLIKEIKPGDSEDKPTTEITYLLDGVAPEGVKVAKREQSGTANTLDAWQFVDGFGRLIQTRSEYKDATKLITSDVFYDSMGRDYKHSNAYPSDPSPSYSTPLDVPASVVEYDIMGRPTKTTNPDLTYSTIDYDHWTTTTTDENGHIKLRSYDANKNLVQVVEKSTAGLVGCNPAASETAFLTNYFYNSLGELLRTQDHCGNVTSSVYDTLGRKITANDQDHGRKDYGYDRVGNQIKLTDARGVTVTNAYDPLNRLLQVTYPHDKGVQYLYDRETIGALAQVTDAAGTVSYKYDNRFRQVRQDRSMDGMTWTTQWSYDALDRVISQTYPDGNVVTFTYNTMGKLSGIPNILSSIDYNERGQETSRNYFNGLSTGFAYDPANERLTKITTAGIQDFTYGYDNVGNVRTIANAANPTDPHNETFTYDDLNRLVNAQDPSTSGYNNTYQYNAIGNMLAETDVKNGATSVAQYTYGLGGAGPHAVTGKSDTKPILSVFNPNAGKSYTTTAQITLDNIAIGNTAEFLASENADFSGATWRTYSSAPLFSLSNGYGRKTVYFKVRNSNKEETTVKNGDVDYLLDSTGKGIPDIFNTDLDGDGIPDAWEKAYCVPPGQADAAAPSGLTYRQAYQYGTDPNKIDTDGDGWSDYDEIFNLHTNPNSKGFDNVHDGVSENYSIQLGRFNQGGGIRGSESFTISDILGKAVEVNILKDTDGDGIPDIIDPDADGDGIPDVWERANGIDMTVPGHASKQLADGLTVLQAYLHGVSPNKTDANGNGWSDYEEIYVYHTDPNQMGIFNVHDGVSENYSLGNGNFNSGGGGKNGSSETINDVIGSQQGQWQNNAGFWITPGVVDFGMVASGTRTAQLTVKNSGSTNLRLNSVSIDGETPLEFGYTNDCLNQIVGPGGACSFMVQFTPIFGGAKGAFLTIGTDDPVKPTLSVNLAGIAAAGFIDTTLPTGSVAFKGNATITNSRNVALTLAATDPSGVSLVCISNSNVCTDWQKYATEKPWVLPEGDGAYTVYVWFRDNAGNSTIAPATATIVQDITPPEVNPSIPGGLYNSSQTVALSANEPGKIYYSLDGANPTTGSAVYAGALTLNLFTQLKFFATDTAGNVGAIRSETYQIDSAPPTGSLKINNGEPTTYSRNVNLTLHADDAGGLAQMMFSNNGNDWTQPENYAFAKSWMLPAGDGIKTVYVKYQDKAGNWSPDYSATIILKTSNKLNLIFSGNGGGSVTSDPTGIACTGSCLGNFTLDTSQAKLMALADAVSYFDGWTGGGCSGKEDCLVPITNDPTVMATFTAVNPVRLHGTPYRYFNKLLDAFTEVQDGSTAIINIRAVELPDVGFDLNRAIVLSLKGGYDSTFTTNGGWTTINGGLTVTKGSLEADGIIVK